MSIKLYGPKQSSAFRCFWAAKELGLEYEHVPVDMQQREHKSESFLRLNPAGQVPVLDHDGFILAESLAINSYLAEVAGSDLMGADAQERANVWRWSLWVLFNVQPALLTLAMPKWTGVHDEAAEAKAREKLLHILPILEARLTENSYLAGNRFTMADINAAPSLSYAEFSGYDLSSYPHITAWLANLMQRPAALAALA